MVVVSTPVHLINFCTVYFSPENVEFKNHCLSIFSDVYGVRLIANALLHDSLCRNNVCQIVGYLDS